jgi:hypothetical protein
MRAIAQSRNFAHTSKLHQRAALASGTAVGLLCFGCPISALAEESSPTTLPPIVVVDTAKKPKHAAPKKPAMARATPSTGSGQANQPAQEAGISATTPAQAALDRKMQGFDQSRDHILTKLGASTDTIDRAAIVAGPQGDNTPVDKLVLQFPGVNYDSAVSTGFANSSFNQPYTTVNLGIARDFILSPGAKPLTVRFDVVNLFDKIYEIRDGSGIGVFAPQFGARRGYYVGLSQKI